MFTLRIHKQYLNFEEYLKSLKDNKHISCNLQYFKNILNIIKIITLLIILINISNSYTKKYIFYVYDFLEINKIIF